MDIAVREGDLSQIQYLVQSGYDINIRGTNDETLLHAAVQCGKLEVFVYLVEQGLDPHRVDSNGETVLHRACLLGTQEIVDFLTKTYYDLIYVVGKDKRSTLHYVSAGGHAEIFNSIVELGVNVYHQDEFGFTVLHRACEKNRYTMVRYLVTKYQPLIAMEAEHGWSVLHTCAACSSVRIFKYLLKKGVNVYAVLSDGRTALHVASFSGNLNIVTYIADTYPVLKKIRDKFGCTPLHESARGGSLNVFKYLVQTGMDVRYKTVKSSTVLHISSRSGNYQMTKYLLTKYPILKRAVDRYGQTALHECVESGNVELMTIMIKHGMDPLGVTSEENSVLHQACKSQNLEMVKYLCTSYPALKTKVNKYGWSALFECAKIGQIEVFKYLLGQCFDVTQTDNRKWTVLDVASHYGNKEMVNYLISTFPILTTKRHNSKL